MGPGIERGALELKGRRTFAAQPLRNATVAEWAWAAGVYEGEGSAHANGRNRTKHDIQIRVTQKDTHILRVLKQFCGGSILPEKRASILNLSGNNARRFVRHTWKWLSPRRQ